MLRKRFYAFSSFLLNRLLTYKPNEAILLFSDPRGGSTWLTEMITTIQKTAVIWEPLHPDVENRFRELNFDSRQYIPEDAEWKEAEEIFRNLFCCKMLSSNSFVLSSPLDFFSAKQILIKFCRANAMLPWITKRFDFKFAPVYLVRHPFAVVASQLRHGSWDIDTINFKIPKTPFSKFYSDHEEFLQTLRTREEYLTAVWCLTNKIPLNNKQNNIGWITIFYEDLIKTPESELVKVFDRWGMEMPQEMLDNIRKKSLTVKEDQFKQDIEEQLRKWEKFFTNEQIKKMDRVLHYFRINEYTSSSPLSFRNK